MVTLHMCVNDNITQSDGNTAQCTRVSMITLLSHMVALHTCVNDYITQYDVDTAHFK